MPTPLSPPVTPSSRREAGIALDYLVVTDPELGPAPARGEARILIAAKVGATRLIDNRAATVGP